MQVSVLREKIEAWMLLHKILQTIELLAIFSSTIIALFSAQIEMVPEKKPVYFVSWFLVSCLAFPYFHRVRNVLGMECTEIQGGSLIGARAFAKYASKLLVQEKKRGINHLLISFRMLKKAYNSKSLVVLNLDDALEKIRIIRRLQDHIPFELLNSLSKGIAKASSSPDLPRLFQDFVSNKKLEFTEGFRLAEKPHGYALWSRRGPFIAILVAAMGTLIQAVISENLKEDIASLLMQIFGSFTIFLLIITFVLAGILAFFWSRLTESTVSWNELP